MGRYRFTSLPIQCIMITVGSKIPSLTLSMFAISEYRKAHVG